VWKLNSAASRAAQIKECKHCSSRFLV
jgi:hypothetical protein